MLPIYREIDIHVLLANILVSCLLAILANVSHQLSHSRCMTVCQQQFNLFFHTIQADFLQVVFTCWIILSRQLHTPIPKAFGTICAFAARLLMMEHEITSF